jgi:multiple sugar transport system permease protein
MQRNTHTLIATALTHLIIISIGVAMIYPILWLIMASFKEGSAIFSDPSLFPKNGTLLNYQIGWKGIANIPFGRFFINSILLCGICVLCNLVFCSMTAYAFGRLQFPFKSLWFGIMMLTLMLPAHVTTIPRWIMFRSFGWIDTYFPMIIPKIFATDAFFIFLLVQFIRGLPRDLDESATLDGCSRVGIFLKIILPLSVPALVTTSLFTFLWTWDDFFNQLLYLNTPAKYTIPLGLRLFLDSSGTSAWGSMFAMSVLSILPCFILFFSLQKYFVQGIATTGMKG